MSNICLQLLFNFGNKRIFIVIVIVIELEFELLKKNISEKDKCCKAFWTRWTQHANHLYMSIHIRLFHLNRSYQYEYPTTSTRKFDLENPSTQCQVTAEVRVPGCIVSPTS